MDIQVEKAIKASLEKYSEVSKSSVQDFTKRVIDVFNLEAPFMEKVSLMDEAFDDEPKLDFLREVFFDLMMINFFAEDVKKLEEDYLDSKEWEDIEEETIDRGTELLNVLLYIRECHDEEIEPELEDFLKEFLLVEEDEFQDEHRIYEDVIANQILMESSIEDIAKASNELPEHSDLKDLFYPIMSFFYQPEPDQEEMSIYTKNSVDPEFDAPVYALLASFNQL
ncbi:hypothetical protein ACFSJU_16640 [Paradesertivirga mongoliensis]|uniref:Uncharacterized protein n=1 Tax=Paradesertivirga mongoliensis TaxID=2100740 RepID=A0ABW4ZPJ4_9SPHI|nr:hypothetical protein [Pedobacter mongoliensis]